MENPYKTPVSDVGNAPPLPPRSPAQVATIFRWLIAFSLAGSILYIGLILLLPGDIDSDMMALLAYRGSLAILPGISQLTYIPFLALLLVAYIGLFAFQRWARVLFMALYLAGMLQGLVDGLDVYAPWESFLITLFTLSDGAILALALTDPLRQRFAGQRPALDQAS